MKALLPLPPPTQNDDGIKIRTTKARTFFYGENTFFVVASTLKAKLLLLLARLFSPCSVCVFFASEHGFMYKDEFSVLGISSACYVQRNKTLWKTMEATGAFNFLCLWHISEDSSSSFHAVRSRFLLYFVCRTRFSDFNTSFKNIFPIQFESSRFSFFAISTKCGEMLNDDWKLRKLYSLGKGREMFRRISQKRRRRSCLVELVEVEKSISMQGCVVWRLLKFTTIAAIMRTRL